MVLVREREVDAGGSIPRRMKAVVLTGPGEFHVGEVDVPEPGPMEVLCRVDSVAICGTDPHIIEGHTKGRWPKGYPFIPGHEWAGVVVKVGTGAERFGWAPGDRVAGTSHAGCGYCRMCTGGRYNMCENYGNSEAGHRQYGHYTNGAYADYVVHSVRSVHRVPANLPLDHAALVDPMSIALHSVKRGTVVAGDTVVIVGPGALGLMAAMCAQALGAARTIVVGRAGERLERARRLGFEVVDYQASDPVAQLRALTGGRGADLTVDCAGTEEAIVWAIDMARKGGRAVLTGVPVGPGVQLPRATLQKLVLEEMDVFGVRANRGTCEECIPLMALGRLDVRPLITHYFPLSEFPRAYEVFTKRIDGALKVILRP